MKRSVAIAMKSSLTVRLSFLKANGWAIKLLGVQILTNLPVSEKRLAYYSRRIITANLTRPEHIEK